MDRSCYYPSVIKTPSPGDLPHGAKWWLIYTHETGCVVQISSGTSDQAEERLLLAKAALRVLAARANGLRRTAYGGETEAETRSRAGEHHGAQPADHGARLGAGRRSVRGNSASSTKPKTNQ
jgi:hypothetical protein